MSDLGKINKNMSEKNLDLGMYGKNKNSNFPIIDIISIVISLVWVAFSIFFLTYGENQDLDMPQNTSFLLNSFIVFVPVAFVITLAMLFKLSRKLKDEASRHQIAIDAMRRTYVAQQQVSGFSVKPDIDQKINSLVDAKNKTENEVAKFSTSRDTSEIISDKAALTKTKPRFKKEEPPLPLDSTENHFTDKNTSVTIVDFIKAANFPDDENDNIGFNALRNALQDRDLAKLLHAAQDSLKIMSKDGIYIDFTGITPGKVELWRDFGNGKRGEKLSNMGIFNDISILEKVKLRFKTDVIFKDVTHHFLRQFDTVFTEFSKNASDDEISEFAKTRTALTFLILASVAGTFD